MIEIQNGEKLLGEAQRIADITGSIQDGEIVVLKKAVDPKWITGVRGYLEEIGRHSLPNYHAIQKGCPNFHRLNHSDDRAYVKGCFHQFSFFPWNQDVFEFFNYLEVGFQIKNLVNGLPRDKFIGNEPEDGCTARVTFQSPPSRCHGKEPILRQGVPMWNSPRAKKCKQTKYLTWEISCSSMQKLLTASN